MDKSTTIIGDFNTSLPADKRKARIQKIWRTLFTSIEIVKSVFNEYFRMHIAQKHKLLLGDKRSLNKV